jgi:hypothetical protein
MSEFRGITLLYIYIYIYVTLVYYMEFQLPTHKVHRTCIQIAYFHYISFSSCMTRFEIFTKRRGFQKQPKRVMEFQATGA